MHRHFYYIYTAAKIPDILSKTIFIDFRRQYCQKTPFNFILTLAYIYLIWRRAILTSEAIFFNDYKIIWTNFFDDTYINAYTKTSVISERY